METPFTFANAPCMGSSLQRFVQPLAMAVLADGPLHGYLILKRLAAFPVWGGREPDKAGVYRLLHTMEERGLVTSSAGAGATRDRQAFALTASGRSCLGQWEETLTCYAGTLHTVLAVLRRANAGHDDGPAGAAGPGAPSCCSGGGSADATLAPAPGTGDDV